MNSDRDVVQNVLGKVGKVLYPEHVVRGSRQTQLDRPEEASDDPLSRYLQIRHAPVTQLDNGASTIMFLFSDGSSKLFNGNTIPRGLKHKGERPITCIIKLPPEFEIQEQVWAACKYALHPIKGSLVIVGGV